MSALRSVNKVVIIIINEVLIGSPRGPDTKLEMFFQNTFISAHIHLRLLRYIYHFGNNLFVREALICLDLRVHFSKNKPLLIGVVHYQKFSYCLIPVPKKAIK